MHSLKEFVDRPLCAKVSNLVHTTSTDVIDVNVFLTFKRNNIKTIHKGHRPNLKVEFVES